MVSAMIKAKGATTVARDARYFVGPNIDADVRLLLEERFLILS